MNRLHLKPNLLDPALSQKIVRTLKPPREDYWKPTKNFAQTIYQQYIIPNIYIILFVIVLLIILFYRYRSIKTERDKKILEEMINQSYQETSPNACVRPEGFTPNACGSKYPSDLSRTPQSSPPLPVDQDEYTKLVMMMYDRQKEDSREPPINRKAISSRIDYLPSPSKKSGFAYPMYPYYPGGKFVSAGKEGKSKKKN